MSRLFRILNDNETIGVVYDSKEHTSPRKQEIIRLWDTLKAVCRFSKETGISLQTAYNTGMKIMDGTILFQFLFDMIIYILVILI